MKTLLIFKETKGDRSFPVELSMDMTLPVRMIFNVSGLDNLPDWVAANGSWYVHSTVIDMYGDSSISNDIDTVMRVVLMPFKIMIKKKKKTEKVWS